MQKVKIIIFLDQAKDHTSFMKTTWKKLGSSLHSNQQIFYLCEVMKQNINMRTEIVKALHHIRRGNYLVEKESLEIVSPDCFRNSSPSEFRFLLMLLRFSAIHLFHTSLKGTDAKLSSCW